MVLLARVPPLAVVPHPAVAPAPVQVLNPVPGSVLGPTQVLAQELVPTSLRDRRLGGAPPSPVAALAPLPETALEAVL